MDPQVMVILIQQAGSYDYITTRCSGCQGYSDIDLTIGSGVSYVSRCECLRFYTWTQAMAILIQPSGSYDYITTNAS
jgi:hypothetical protein